MPPALEAPWPEPNGTTATYPLHCHCGAVKYTITLSPPLYAEHTTPSSREQWAAVECNCSHCERTGALNVHPLAKDLVFTQGEAEMVEYRCGGRENPHFNCGKCGCFLVTDLGAIMEKMGLERRFGVNLRMLKDFDRSKLLVKPDTVWRDMPPKYEV